MTQNQEVRLRIEAMNIMVSRHKGEDERSQFKATPYVFLQRGFVLPVYQEEYDDVVKDLKATKAFPDTKLELWEQLSYGNYFRVLYPEKICGQEFATSSGAYPVKVKGTMLDVQRVIKNTLEGNNNFVESDLYMDNVQLKRVDKEAGVLNVSFNIKRPKASTNRRAFFHFKIDKSEKLIIGKDNLPELTRASVANVEGVIFREIENKILVRKFLESNDLQDILKPYYPEGNDQHRARRIRINAGKAKALLLLLKLP